MWITFYRQVYWAITEFSFYKSVIGQPIRQTFLFLLYLCAHASLVLTLVYAFYLGPDFQDFGIWIQENVPPMEVNENKLRVEAKQPLVQTYWGRTTLTLVFDTTGTHRDLDQFEEPALLFTENALFLRQNQTTEKLLWRDIGPFRITPEHLRDWVELVKWGYFPTAYTLLLVFTFLVKLILALLFALLARSVTSRYQIRLPFASYLSIATYSLTPAAVIELAVSLTGLALPFLELISLGTTAIYTYMATERIITEDKSG